MNLNNLKDRSWYWVKLKFRKDPLPCKFIKDKQNVEESSFIIGGIGDTSSNGADKEDIQIIGPEIIVPDFSKLKGEYYG